MKIYKFNESINQGWSEERISNLYDETYNFFELALNYIFMRNDYPEHTKNKYSLDEFWFEEVDTHDLTENDTYFSVSFNGGNKLQDIIYEFTKDDFDEFLIYMNDPDLYTNSKKYNL